MGGEGGKGKKEENMKCRRNLKLSGMRKNICIGEELKNNKNISLFKLVTTTGPTFPFVISFIILMAVKHLFKPVHACELVHCTCFC
jgi:hypothetical protein